jgi:replication factor A1
MSNPESQSGSSENAVKVKELKPGMEGVTVDVRVLESHGVRTVETKSGTRTLGEYVVGDESGRVKLIVWGQKAGSLNVGDAVEIKNAWVTTYRGEVQLNAGKNSEITKIDDNAVPQAESIPEETPEAPQEKGASRPRGRRGGHHRGRR